MITEHAILCVRDGEEDLFESAMAHALALIEAAPGCFGASVQRQIEDPSTYLLLVSWESVAAHEDGFRQSVAFERWRELTHHFYRERPSVTHFTEPISRK